MRVKFKPKNLVRYIDECGSCDEYIAYYNKNMSYWEVKSHGHIISGSTGIIINLSTLRYKHMTGYGSWYIVLINEQLFFIHEPNLELIS